MVELEPVPEEEAVDERDYRPRTTISRSHGRVDVMADMTALRRRAAAQADRATTRATPARRAPREILADWKRYRPKFRKVMPVEYRRALAEMAKEKAAAMQAAE